MKKPSTLLFEEGDDLLQLRLLVQVACSVSLYSLGVDNPAGLGNRILKGMAPLQLYFFGAIVVVGFR